MDGGDILKRPKNLRTILLAYPKHLTKKYKPPVYIPGTVDSGVKPSTLKNDNFDDNWRLNQLSQTYPRNKSDKYVYVEEEGVGTGISTATLAGKGTSRTDDLARPVHRYVVQNKLHFQRILGERFVKNISKAIDQSWNSIYNYYKRELQKIIEKRRARRERLRAAKRKPTKPKSPKELKAEKEKRIAAWCAIRALPKKIFKPPPPKKRKIADLVKMQGRINQLSEPRHATKKYLRPSIDVDYVDPLRVRDSAKTYQITERVVELSKCPAHRLAKEPVIIPGSVKRSALKCKVSPRFAELAVPKKKAAEKDNDLKENPFMISPNALKYVATTRIQELAQPIER